MRCLQPDKVPLLRRESAACLRVSHTGNSELCQGEDRSSHTRQSSGCPLIQSIQCQPLSWSRTGAERPETSVAYRDLSSLVAKPVQFAQRPNCLRSPLFPAGPADLEESDLRRMSPGMADFGLLVPRKL